MSDSETTGTDTTSSPEATAEKSAKAKELVITLKKSGIGKSRDQKATIKGLGFKRLNQTVRRKDTPAIRGMVEKISHLLEVQ